MTTIINRYSDYAMVMQAAYGYFDPNDLNDTKINSILPEKKQANFTPTQAQAFIGQFDVIDHTPDDDVGFSATLFRDTKNGNQLVLGVRGTDPGDLVRDLAADAVIGALSR